MTLTDFPILYLLAELVTVFWWLYVPFGLGIIFSIALHWHDTKGIRAARRRNRVIT